MIFGIISIVLEVTPLFFADIGIQGTIARYGHTHGMAIFRDLLKYLVLLISVLITCFGLSGLLGQLMDSQNVNYFGKLDAARWLAFIVVGIPVIVVMTRWIRRDFQENSEAENSPAWQIYLLAATTTSLLFWFIPLSSALQFIVGEPFKPRALAQSIVAFIVWSIHATLMMQQRTLIANFQRFTGWATGLTAAAVASIQVVGFLIAKWIDVTTGKYQLQNALILLVVSAPVAIYYWEVFDNNAADNEARIYRIFAGMAVPTVFFVGASVLSLTSVLVWNFGQHIQDSTRFFRNTPWQLATILILAPMIWYFRHLASGFIRDEVTRLYQYLIAGAALLAAGVAGGWLIAGLFEFSNFANTFIGGLSGLIVTVPIWWSHWRTCQFANGIDFQMEDRSPIRRIYLYLMIGIPTISSIASAVWMFYLLFKAMLLGGFTTETFKVPFGALVTSLVIALYQWRIYRGDYRHRMETRAASKTRFAL